MKKRFDEREMLMSDTSSMMSTSNPQPQPQRDNFDYDLIYKNAQLTRNRLDEMTEKVRRLSPVPPADGTKKKHDTPRSRKIEEQSSLRGGNTPRTSGNQQRSSSASSKGSSDGGAPTRSTRGVPVSTVEPQRKYVSANQPRSAADSGWVQRKSYEEAESVEPISQSQYPASSSTTDGGFNWGLLGLAALGGIAVGAGVGLLFGHFLLAPVVVTTTVPVAGATFGGTSGAVVAASNAAGPAAVTAATTAGNAAVATKTATAVTIQTQMLTAAHNAALNTSVPAATQALTDAGITSSVTTAAGSVPYAEAAIVGGTCGAVGALGTGVIAMKTIGSASKQRITDQK
eukprot:PhF_6_TR28330/c0_g1_i1/m.41979